MRSDGEIDFEKKVIRVNKPGSKKHKGGIIDTVVHEDMHRLHPRMSEKVVRKKTATKIERMSSKSKTKQYSKLKRKK